MQSEYVRVGSVRLLEPCRPSDNIRDRRPVELGMSESLAHGLVSRMTAESRERSKRQRGKTVLRESGKRAAAYRLAKQYLRELVPPGLGVCEVSVGDASGKSKDGHFTVFHFSHYPLAPDEHQDQLFLLLSEVESRYVETTVYALARVTRHSLMRLFYRLKVTEELPVLEELREMSLRMYKAMYAMCYLGPEAVLFVPSRHGMFVVARDREHLAHIVVKTWMSNQRIQDNQALIGAMLRARAQWGVVVDHPGVYPVLSDQSLKELTGFCMENATPAVLNSVCRAVSGRHPLSDRCLFSDNQTPKV